jgi:SAM-dependent methyltransferase
MHKFIRWLINPPGRPVTIKDHAARLAEKDLSGLDWLYPPSDLHAAEPWDTWWRGQIEHGVAPGWTDMFCDDNALLDTAESRGLKSVLCVGCGVSQEPHALAAAGLQVTAMDLSPFALRCVARLAERAEPAGRFLTPGRIREGGSLSFVEGDLMDPAICPGPFDVIVERKTLQLFPNAERRAAVARVVGRLAPNGIFLSHYHNGAWKPSQPRTHLIEALLDPGDFQIARHAAVIHPEGRVAFLIMSTG